MAVSNRICGEQDCEERTSKPNHPLCYGDYSDLQDGLIDECPNHPGVYKSVKYKSCRLCYSVERTSAKKTSSRTRRKNNAKGWDNPFVKSVVKGPHTKAVERVRRNMDNHSKECSNHESNTIQYLVEPMLRGLGWDFDDPKQVIREYRPEGDRRKGKRGIAVDVALLENGTPKVFVEAKRLDRVYDQAYKKQIDRYASYMEEGTAVLTNGRFWILSPVLHGTAKKWDVIDVSEGDPEQVGEKLQSAIGMSIRKQASGSPSDRAKSTKSSTPTEASIIKGLRDYRLRESRRRNKPAFTILGNKAIELIASQKPNSVKTLATIKGVGSSTLKEHGAAILKIVRG